MKKAIIADISSLSYEGKIYGHFVKAASLFKNVMDEDYDVIVAGSKAYKQNFSSDSLLELPFSRKKEECKSKIKKIKDFCGELKNTRHVLAEKSDVLIFQSYSKLPIYMGLLLFTIRANRIYMIEYQKTEYQGIVQRIQSKALSKINGIITSSDTVGRHFGIEYIVIPDYFYTKPTKIDKISPIYDFGIVGTVANDKMYEDVVANLKGCPYTLIIAGKFMDSNRLKNLTEMADDNITIQDKYLTDEEYKEILMKCRYIVLPYNPLTYSGKSSGVVLDALYNNKPVIVPRIDSFEFIEKYRVGIMYNTSFAEIVSEKNGGLRDRQFDDAISVFVSDMKLMTDRFLQFIEGDRI